MMYRLSRFVSIFFLLLLITACSSKKHRPQDDEDFITRRPPEENLLAQSGYFGEEENQTAYSFLPYTPSLQLLNTPRATPVAPNSVSGITSSKQKRPLNNASVAGQQAPDNSASSNNAGSNASSTSSGIKPTSFNNLNIYNSYASLNPRSLEALAEGSAYETPSYYDIADPIENTRLAYFVLASNQGHNIPVAKTSRDSISPDDTSTVENDDTKDGVLSESQLVDEGESLPEQELKYVPSE